MINKKCKELADIICDFRSGEIAKIDANHVKKWIVQFENSVQIPILEEMIYVFSDWYLTRHYIIVEYLNKIPTILQNKYSFKSEYETLKKVSFVSIQNVGQSQKILIAELKKIKHEQYGVDLLCDINSSINHYVYIDDGFYSGSRARKDIKEVIYQLKHGDTLDVFYLVICSSGFMFAKDEFKRLSNECNVEIKFHPLATIYNERREHTEYKDGTETVWWMKNHMCLWPSQSSKGDNEIDEYYNYLHTLLDNCEKYPYRCSHWINDEGIFSSADRRSLVEHEFLKNGIQIVNSYSNNKGMYPLGYNLWPSFGFGVLFATEFNVPNNAPLVIWAETSNWYPLLPRRVNNQNDIVDLTDMYDYDEVYSKSDQYNMCPDCGNLFGLDGDGGNGFCVECVWKH
jgi:hypothetical protein